MSQHLAALSQSRVGELSSRPATVTSGCSEISTHLSMRHSSACYSHLGRRRSCKCQCDATAHVSSQFTTYVSEPLNHLLVATAEPARCEGEALRTSHDD